MGFLSSDIYWGGMRGPKTEPLIGQERSSSSKPRSKLSTIEQRGERENAEEKVDFPAWLLIEIQKLFSLAGPLICVHFVQYAISIVSLMFAGRLGELELASAAIASTFAGLTGISVMVGMGSALEAISEQACGAKRNQLVGIYLQRGILVLNAIAIPVACLWLNVSSVLRVFGQDSTISHHAGLYASCMVPALFACATSEPLVIFLAVQSRILAMILSSALTLGLHVGVCWLLVLKLGLGISGAAIACSVSHWMNVVFLVISINFGPKTWTGFSTEAFHDLKMFSKSVLPSAVMMCLERWTLELIVLLSGLLPSPQLEMSALSLSANTAALAYMIPLGLGEAVSTRVSNELSSGRASTAKKAAMVGSTLGFVFGLIISGLVSSERNVWPRAFTDSPEVVAYVSKLVPYLAVLIVIDSTQGVLCGVMRGCGKQAYGAYTNIGAYYVVGIPLAWTLAFHNNLNGLGLWLGMIAALYVQATALLTICIVTNWEKQAQDALDRDSDQVPTDELIIDKASRRMTIQSIDAIDEVAGLVSGEDLWVLDDMDEPIIIQ